MIEYLQTLNSLFVEPPVPEETPSAGDEAEVLSTPAIEITQDPMEDTG